jgi:1-aminocyclopropane-1-carboxylate deaminase/D-cysteine desulfhydrase-like pyridoxal-dependent ACC family enzyme
MNGNYANALSLGMQHKEIRDELYRDFIASLSITLDEKTFLIDQGGAVQAAKEGLAVLADEIREEVALSKEYQDIKAVATPSGTGTTALFLALALPEYTIYTTPCVGDSAYLKEQMEALHTLPENLIILEPKKKYHFAKPYLEFLNIYDKLKKESRIEFDLLYAPGMWLALLEQTDEKLIYVHSGGVSGNESMLQRYAMKNLARL